MLFVFNEIVTKRGLRAIKHLQFFIQSEETIQYYSVRIPASPIADVECGVVMLGCARANQYGIFFTSPRMNQLARVLMANPFGIKILFGDKAIGRLGPL